MRGQFYKIGPTPLFLKKCPKSAKFHRIWGSKMKKWKKRCLLEKTCSLQFTENRVCSTRIFSSHGPKRPLFQVMFIFVIFVIFDFLQKSAKKNIFVLRKALRGLCVSARFDILTLFLRVFWPFSEKRPLFVIFEKKGATLFLWFYAIFHVIYNQ